MKENFKNPPAKFRPIPFWSWNDALDPEELKRQIKEMKQSGIGGYFMHARSGLKTEYLSEKWFKCIEEGIRMAKEEGMDAWIYDEEGWPSGFAGGIVPAMSESYQSKYMTLEYVSEDYKEDENQVLAYYGYRKSDGSYRLLGKDEGALPEEDEELLAVLRHVNPYYIDTLNKSAVDAFLECTHQAYFKRFGKDFGKSMQGFFTDEPRLACNHFGELAWSDELPKEFKKSYGYDMMEHLPALYLRTPNCEKYRYDFWSLVNRMFAENYMKNIYDWCEAHDCKATGHIMMEESIFSQMTSTGGVMPFYEYLHIPGIDWLRRMISSPIVAKQVGSVACQLGKKQVLTESFALCGWNVSLEELKWIAEWQFVNGVNQICQHLMAYTIKGCRKRDYPPSHFTQQTWWKESGLFHDYLGRLCVALSEGDQTADVLLIHPMRSGYVSYDGTRTEEISRLDDIFTETCEYLSGNHISYHLGDETIMGKYGCVEDGLFVVGRIHYKTVILPTMYAIDGKTLILLSQFADEGGTILSSGDFPEFTNGDPELLEKVKRLVKPVAISEIRQTLFRQNLISLSVTVDGREIEDISYLQRECEQGTLLFLVNHSQTAVYHGQVRRFGEPCSVTLLSAEDGTEQPLAYKASKNETDFQFTFQPMGSCLVLLKPDKEGSLLLEEPQLQTVKPGEAWNINSMGPNSLTLDYCSYRIDGGSLLGPIPVIKLQDTLLELRRPCDVELQFSFEVDMNLDKNKAFDVVIEDAAQYRVEINGTEVATENLTWWKDKSFHRVPIKPYVKNGQNLLILKTRFSQPQKVYDVLFGDNVYETEKNKITYDIEIESIYLLGDFGVYSKAPFCELERNALSTEGPFIVKDSPCSLKGHDFTTQGLLFFAETAELSQSIEIHKEPGKRVMLDFGHQNAPLLKLCVNGQLVKNSLWAPYTADITEAAHDGENLLKVQIFASNRNLLGPHHHVDGECYNVGPDSFTGRWSWVERTSEADATDISDREKNYWTDSYSFVHFGFQKKD